MEKSVKEVAELTGISVRTLQYYDDEGILVPKRNNLNHRIYTEVDLQKLWKIYFLKNAGLSLNEIKEYLKDNNIKIIMNKKKQLYKKSYELIKKMALLDIFTLDGIGNCPLQNFKIEILKKLKDESRGDLYEKSNFDNDNNF